MHMVDRIDITSTETALAPFEKHPTATEYHCRYHDHYDDDDGDDLLAVAKIALCQPSLTERAFAHLVPLLGRLQGS